MSHKIRSNQGKQLNEDTNAMDQEHICDSDWQKLRPPQRSIVSRQNGNMHRQSSSRSMSYSKRLIFLLAMCLLLRLLLIYWVRSSEVELPRRAILLWNDLRPAPRLRTYSECGCIITNQPNYSLRPFDAIVFNADGPYTLRGLDAVQRNALFLAVYAATQPLSHVENPLLPGTLFPYNLTMTYRRDSDLVWRQYHILPRTDTLLDEISLLESSGLSNALEQKFRLAFYLLYEVNEQTLDQSVYLEELRKHITLDAYDNCHNHNDCSVYQFMFVFELSGCPDYVHPQIYTALDNYVVPVIVGAANMTDLMPPGSYIDASDFHSPKDLANHLVLLSSEPEQYESLFFWQYRYQLHKITQPYCALCRLLLQRQYINRPTNNGRTFRQWWAQLQCPNRTKKHSH